MTNRATIASRLGFLGAEIRIGLELDGETRFVSASLDQTRVQRWRSLRAQLAILPFTDVSKNVRSYVRILVCKAT